MTRAQSCKLVKKGGPEPPSVQTGPWMPRTAAIGAERQSDLQKVMQTMW